MKSPRRVSLSPAFVLHHYAYRDTSRIVEAFTLEHGRLALFARGVTGTKSGLRGALRPFQRLLLSWYGKSDACQLQGAEIDGEPTTLPAARLMSGFYLNELLLKLTLRADPHPRIFDCYGESVRALCAGEDEESVLRRFEKRLLDELGYGLQLTNTAEGRRVESTMYYRFTPQRGPQPCVADAPGAIYGQSLADLAAETFTGARSLRDAKHLLRAAIDECLEGRTLMSRRIMLDLRRRERA